MLLMFLEVTGAVLFVWFMVTQILIPLTSGTKLFPAFRSGKKAAIEDLIIDERDKIEEEELLHRLKELRKKRQQGFTLYELMVAIIGLFALGVMIAIIVVATHFIAKFW